MKVYQKCIDGYVLRNKKSIFGQLRCKISSNRDLWLVSQSVPHRLQDHHVEVSAILLVRSSIGLKVVVHMSIQARHAKDMLSGLQGPDMDIKQRKLNFIRLEFGCQQE